MARFALRPLRLLDRIYRFVGGDPVESTMDLTSPIIRVHDLSREAELGSIVAGLSDLGSPGQNRGPFFTIVDDDVHAIAGTLFSTLGVYSTQVTTWAVTNWAPPNPDEETVWVLAVGMQSTNELGTSGIVTLERVPKAGSGSGLNAEFPLGVFGASVPGGITGLGVMPPTFLLPRPVPIYATKAGQTPLRWSSTVSGADTIDCYIHCLRLPLGVMPPGAY